MALFIQYQYKREALLWKNGEKYKTLYYQQRASKNAILKGELFQALVKFLSETFPN